MSGERFNGNGHKPEPQPKDEGAKCQVQPVWKLGH